MSMLGVVVVSQLLDRYRADSGLGCCGAGGGSSWLLVVAGGVELGAREAGRRH